eukprot:CAMPEP_0197627680 /NCGR_PEP_ID=MMETSP1338-20131121/6224_1 /TAXON_ID=43686 ORGANISM="Pelagodinium beii, Strain RCC1491" /NCGR_SAMPLE_ID=MMETSP1338 /ASSEMBLY_ACC=CAM_ASM_000754 /LENGTH=279 /DNA_ID=CAMNT_0043198463 /DNA_START=25 /DNA_END=862 /DNA_ORIENTATION=+
MAVVCRRPDQAIPENPSIQDLVSAIRLEREAREAAMADQTKLLDWRFVQFSQEFNFRLEQLAQRHEEAFEDEPSRSSQKASMDNEVTDSQRRHLQEGKLAILDARVVEMQRWHDSLEAQLDEQRAELRKVSGAQARLQELEVWLTRADLRLTGLEVKTTGRQSSLAPTVTSTRTSPSNSSAGTPGGVKAAPRLTPVERVSLDARPPEASLDETEVRWRTVMSQAHHQARMATEMAPTLLGTLEGFETKVKVQSHSVSLQRKFLPFQSQPSCSGKVRILT